MNLLKNVGYTGKQGLYCGAYVNPMFVPLFEDLCDKLGLPAPDPEELHCTVMYSPEGVAARLPTLGAPLNGTVCSVQHWVGHNGKIYVVADLQSMGMCAAHTSFHKAGARASFAAYRPHITLGKIESVDDDFEGKVEAVNWMLKEKPAHVVFTDVRVKDINQD